MKIQAQRSDAAGVMEMRRYVQGILKSATWRILAAWKCEGTLAAY